MFKAYEHLAQLAEEDPTSPHNNIINSSRRQTLALQQNQQNSESGQIPRSLSNSCYNLRDIPRMVGGR
jgi:hypothetical protein